MGHSTNIERKYALMKLEAGDYLLPGNDGETIWRIVKTEDGPSHGLDPKVFPRDFVVWSVWKWEGRERPEDEGDLRLDDGRWNCHAAHAQTRAEAIQEALRTELPRPEPSESKRSLAEAIRSMAAGGAM